MEFPAHIVFSCLLVCQPAIFVDSKRDGIRAAQRQNASDEELVRQGKRTYGEELTRLYDLDLSGWRVIGHYGCGRGYEGRSWYDMGKPFGRR